MGYRAVGAPVLRRYYALHSRRLYSFDSRAERNMVVSLVPACTVVGWRFVDLFQRSGGVVHPMRLKDFFD